MTYCTQGVHTNHYTTNAVTNNTKKVIAVIVSETTEILNWILYFRNDLITKSIKINILQKISNSYMLFENRERMNKIYHPMQCLLDNWYPLLLQIPSGMESDWQC